VAKFYNFGATVTIKNCIHENIKSRLNQGNACYRSVQSFVFLSNIKMYETTILPFVLCGCETWSLTLREEHRLRMFENRVLRRIFGPKREEVVGG